MGFAVLLYATYSQWTYVTEPPLTVTQQSPDQQVTQQAPQASNDVLNLSDTLPAIEDRAISQEAPSNSVRTEVIQSNVIELYINPSKGADIVGAKLTKYHPSKKEQETPVELLTLAPESYHYFQTGVLSTDNKNEANHTQPFKRLSGPTQRDGKTSVKYVWHCLLYTSPSPRD